MAEALVPTSKRLKVILTIVLDGGGRSLYEAWPDAWPVIKDLAARAVDYTDAKVTQLETATALPRRVTQSFPDYSPEFIMAPTLADEYGVSAGHKPVVIGTFPGPRRDGHARPRRGT